MRRHQAARPGCRRDRGDGLADRAGVGWIVDVIADDAKDVITFAAGTGVRWGELSALQVRDCFVDPAHVDAGDEHIKIVRAWKRNGDPGHEREPGEGRYVLGSPKTQRSRRTIYLDDVTSTSCDATSPASRPRTSFHRAAGRVAVPAHLYADRWLPAVRAAQERHGLTKQPRFHDLRHTHAVWLITAGVPLPVIQDRLGHQSIQITVDVYGGFLTQAHDVVGRVLSAALRGEKVRHLRSA